MSLMVFLVFLFELSSAILATLYFKKYPHNFMRYFLIYLWIILGVESFAYLTSWATQIYNYYTFFEFNLLYIIYYKISSNKIHQRIIKFIAITFNIIYFLSFIIINLQSDTVSIGSFSIGFILLLYLKEFLNSDEILNYKKSLYFWVTFGLLVYYLGTTPIQYVLKQINVETFRVQNILTIFAHSCIIIGLLWGKKTN